MIIDDDNVMIVGKPTIGQKMRRTREIRGVKQGAVAQTIGVSQQTISEWEKLETIPKSSLQKYAEALEVNMEDIINFEEKAITQIFTNCKDSGNACNGVYNNYVSSEILELLEKYLKEFRDNTNRSK